MRKSSAKSDHSESIVNKSPLPWAGVAAASNIGPNSVKSSVQNGMVSFASAARTSKPLHSTSGEGSIEGQKTFTKKFEQASPSPRPKILLNWILLLRALRNHITILMARNILLKKCWKSGRI